LCSSLWLVPLACVLAGIALSFATSAIDSATGYRLIPRGVTGSPAAAQTILSTDASAMVTLTSLTLSLTLVATSSRCRGRGRARHRLSGAWLGLRDRRAVARGGREAV